MACAVIVSALKTKIPISYSKDDYLIACDMGYDRAKAVGLKPDVIIGDFDSLGYVPNETNVLKLPVKKDDTDTGYAINYAINKGFSDIKVYGAVGGLVDHTFAVFQLAADASRRGINIVLYGDDCALTAVTNGKLCLEEGVGRFSVFAVNECQGVTIKDAEFELDNASLSPFMPLGVSNCRKGKTTIEVKSGTLVVVNYL